MEYVERVEEGEKGGKGLIFPSQGVFMRKNFSPTHFNYKHIITYIICYQMITKTVLNQNGIPKRLNM